MAPLQESVKGVIVLKETRGQGGREGDFSFFRFTYLSLCEELARLMQIMIVSLAPPLKVVASAIKLLVPEIVLK